MDRVRRETLISIRDQMACHRWSDAEVTELAEPTLGIITGLPDLLDRLEALRRIDLGATPPA